MAKILETLELSPSTEWNNFFNQAHELGNLLASDRNTISVAGDISEFGDIDWYTFTLDYITEQERPFAWSTVFDIDYADGMRGDLSLSVFNAAGELIYVGHDSDIADDQAGLGQENDFDDLARGSLGKLDPFIGSAFLPANSLEQLQGGNSARYYVAVTNNQWNSNVLDQFRQNFEYQINPQGQLVEVPVAATQPLARVEPVTSVERIVEDHIGTTGYNSHGNEVSSRGIINIDNELALSAHVREFTLADMTAFLTTTGGLRTFNPLTGQLDATPAGNAYSYIQDNTNNNTNVGNAGDLDMLTDGTLVAYINGVNDDVNVGRVWEVDPGSDTSLLTQRYGDSISNDAGPTNDNPPPADDVWRTNQTNVDALVIGRSGYNGGTNTVEYNPSGNDSTGGSAGSAVIYSIRDNDNFEGVGGTRSVLYGANSAGNASSSIRTAGATHDYGRFGWVPGGNGPEAVGNPGANVPAGFTINGFTTGLQFRNEVRNQNQLYAVSQGGQFFRVTPRDADLRRANDNNTEGAVFSPGGLAFPELRFKFLMLVTLVHFSPVCKATITEILRIGHLKVLQQVR